jgi:predicted dehydrogenase
MNTSLDRRTFAAGSALLAATTALPRACRGQASKAPLKLGILSDATYGRPGQPRTPGSNHGTAFCTTFNGWDAKKAAQFKGTFVKSGRRLNSARVVKVWDPDQAAATALAAICNVPTVARTPEECCEGVDSVLIVDDGSGAQWKYAEYPLKKGVPTFCDKPLAMTAREATAIARLARQTKTPFMSASSLRFVPDIVKLRGELPQLGEVRLASAVCGNDLIYYGIHALSMIYAVLGKGATSAINVGRPGSNIARLRFGDERDVVLMVAEKETMRVGFQINLYGTKGRRSVTPNLANLYSYLLEAFLDLVLTGSESVLVEEEVEVIAALEAAKRSLDLGRDVQLSEVFT